jgi:TolA-binding protein
MSLIHQALKKAQRERLLHEAHPGAYTTRLSSSRPSRRWLLFAAGLVLAFGVGAVLHAWFPLVSRRPSHTVQAPPPIQQASMGAQSASSPALGPAKTPAAVQQASAPARRPVSSRPQDATATRPVSPAPAAGTPQPSLTKPSVPSTGQKTAASEPVAAAPSPQVSPQARSRAHAAFERAMALQKSGDETRAMSFLEQAVALDPTLKEAYNGMGSLYYRRGQYPDALTAYQNALSIDPNFVKARNNLGSTYLRLAKIDRAREELHKVVQTDDSYGLAYYNLACAYARGGDSAAAARYLRRAMQLEPEARSWALTDDDFASVRTTPELQRLLGSS